MHALTIFHDDATALSAIALLASQQLPGAQMTLGGSFSPPPPDVPVEADAELVNAIAEIFDPQELPVFRQFLRGIYSYKNTLNMTEGSFTMRGGPSTAARRLRRKFPDGKVKATDLWHPRRTHSSDGRYLATEYKLTALGEAVLKRMWELGTI